ncbi:hypothetical protein SSX86_010771 [Deinandra increscens subsp. villosa]|uniref:MBD domain-containing protein n=1 Tax=Deinandra increscens subsp. villosa TaxID=3103831 RepID=A0AAP0D8K9_9ASTR
MGAFHFSPNLVPLKNRRSTRVFRLLSVSTLLTSSFLNLNRSYKWVFSRNASEELAELKSVAGFSVPVSEVAVAHQIVVEKDEAEGLPQGWKTEVKIRKRGSVKKIDRLYTDPVTGYIFRSLRDAQRYLKTGELGRLALKPKVDAQSSALTPEAKSCEAADDASLSSPSPIEPKTHKATCQAGVKIDSPPSQPEPIIRQAKRGSGNRDSALLPQPKTRRATRQSGIKIESPPDARSSRQSTRGRVVEVATPQENNMKTEAEKIIDKHYEKADRDNNAKDNQEKSSTIPPVNQESNEKKEVNNILPPVTPKEHNREIEMGPETLLTSEDQAPPTVVPPVDFEKQKPAVSNPIPQDGHGYGDDMKSNSSVNFSINDLWTDPCIEFAVKTLTGASPFEDSNKPANMTPSPLEASLEELWTDPCIEFAVKTLTGAIPVREDDHLPPRPTSSRNPRAPYDSYLPDAGMSFCQTGVLSKHFETGQNKQQDSKFGNAGLQKSGNVVNGQGSRSRFFQ